MTETSTIPFPDLVFVCPPATTSAATVSPKAVAAPHSNLTLRGVASVTSAAPGLSPPVPQVGLGAADFSSSDSVVAKDDRGAPALAGVSSLDLPAASSGAAGLSFEDDVSAPEAVGFPPRVSVKNSITFLVAAASETISNSVSTTSIPTT